MSNGDAVKEIDVVIERREQDGEVELRAEEDDILEEEWREETLVEHIGRAARENPMSAALIGAGLVWMAMGGARNLVRGADVAGTVVGDAARAAGSAARQTAQAVGDAVVSTAETAQDTAVRAGKTAVRSTRQAVRTAERAASKGVHVASRKASRAEDYAEGAAKQAGSAVSQAGEEVTEDLQSGMMAVQRGGERALRAAGDLAQNHPILYSALCLATGAGAAALLPRTRTEDELLGEYSGEAARAARRRAASLVAGSVKTARARTSEAVQEAARKAAEEAAERVLRQADSIGDAVVDTFDRVSRNVTTSKGPDSEGDEDKERRTT